MVLRIIASYGRGPVNKFNLLGRTPSEGGISYQLGRDATDEEKQLASKCWDELMDSDHLQLDLNQLMQTGHWAFMTEKGRYALQNGLFDSLDEKLNSINAHLVVLRDGANEALLSTSSNTVQQAANSGRELINQTLRNLAPETEVVKVEWFEPDPNAKNSNGVNFGHRVRFALDKAGIDDVDEIEMVQSSLRLANKRFVAGAHACAD